jgi:CHASE2 domain-containing sensor protein
MKVDAFVAALNELGPRLKERLKSKSIISVFIIVAAWNVALSFDWIQEHFPVTLDTQLRFYNVLWSWGGRAQYNSTVSIVRIDDSLHWGQSICDSPTSKHLLAQLVGNAATALHKASAVALDVELFAPVGKPAGWHGPNREPGDDELLNAINNAARNGVPVIVPIGLLPDGKGGWTRIPNIYRDEDLPLEDEKGKCGYSACAVLGFIKLPTDKREIPLQETTRDWYKGSKVQYIKSFALAAADAKARTHAPPSSRPLIQEAIARNNQIFGGFIPETEFLANEISARKLAEGDESAIANVERSLVVIGGNWHSEQGYGPEEDLHLSPLGQIPGLMFHANYIEALLGDHFTQPISLWLAIVIDILIGVMLYASFDLIRGWVGQIVVIGLFIIPILLAYISFVNFHRYLDFVFPTILYLVHLTYEHSKAYVSFLWNRRLKNRG